jgi:hypothetical protein
MEEAFTEVTEAFESGWLTSIARDPGGGPKLGVARGLDELPERCTAMVGTLCRRPGNPGLLDVKPCVLVPGHHARSSLTSCGLIYAVRLWKP